MPHPDGASALGKLLPEDQHRNPAQRFNRRNQGPISMRTATPLNSPVSLGILRALGFALPAVFAAVLVATLGGARMLCAQTPAITVPAHKPAHPHKRPVAVQAQSPTPQAAA